jgi:DNA replication protein DnaC
VDDKMRKISPADLATIIKVQPAAQPASPSQANPNTTGAGRNAMTLSVTTPTPSHQFDPCVFDFCDGSGWYKEAVPYGHPNFGQLFACQCRIAGESAREAERRRGRLAKLESEMGGELASSNLDNYDLRRAVNAEARKTMRAALDTCRAYAHRASGWLYLYGPTGVGKSHLAAATARALAEKHSITLAYASEPALMKYIRAGWGKKDDDGTDARMVDLQNVDLLIIDDIGTEHRGKAEKAWADSQLLDILMPRYQHERWTILTSNLELDDIDEPRIRSRVKGRTSIEFAGRDQCLLVINSDQREGGKQ